MLLITNLPSKKMLEYIKSKVDYPHFPPFKFSCLFIKLDPNPFALRKRGVANELDDAVALHVNDGRDRGEGKGTCWKRESFVSYSIYIVILRSKVCSFVDLCTIPESNPHAIDMDGITNFCNF